MATMLRWDVSSVGWSNRRESEERDGSKGEQFVITSGGRKECGVPSGCG